MKLPTEQQLRDPDYWNMVAPEWATMFGLPESYGSPERLHRQQQAGPAGE